ncbi:SDR family NAD(P)-dependent oxidoreductase [Parapedomonas caeni]
MAQLIGKAVLVTGGSRGIGAAIVKAVAHGGGFPIIHYGHRRDAAEALLKAIGGQGAIVHGDLRALQAARRIWDQAVAASPEGRIDVLVNNAAISYPSGIEAEWEQWGSDWANTLQINVVATADFCKEAVPHFQLNGGGRIITLTSRAVHRGDQPQYMHYAASKAGQAAITKSIARAYARDHILAFNVAPGFTRTDMAEEWVQTYGEASASGDIPLGRMATPEEIGQIVAWLASEAPASLTGATLDANGASYVR